MASQSRIRNGFAWSLVFIELIVLFHLSNFVTVEGQCHHHHSEEGEESHHILEDDADDHLTDTITSIGGTTQNDTHQEDASSPQIHRETPCGKRVLIKGGKFLMGSEDKSAYPMDGESPVREMTVGDFEMSACETTNEEFQRFVDATNYTTEAEAFGWSFVFMYFVSDETLEKITQAVAAAPHWVPVEGADWRHPEEPQSNITNRMDHPVVHVSWNDAKRYCEWAGGRLPTEKEWEYAARGGLEGKKYPWGDETVPRGTKGEPVYKCNFFQGRFPEKNTGADGYLGTAPAWAYEPNGYGLYNVAGNVWEWCEDNWSIDHSPIGQQRKVLSQRQQQPEEVRKVQKGGSYMCHVRVCHRFRPAARMGNTPDSSGGNLGFRCLWDV